MELLTILYALLAAVTGIAGGDRALVAQRASVMVQASSSAALAVKAVAPAAGHALRPMAATARRWMGDAIAAPRPGASPAAFHIAGFANRRE